MTRARRCAALALLLACAGAGAHDSWLEAGAPGGELRLVTGAHFPLAETSAPAAGLAASGCVDANGRRGALQRTAARPAASATAPAACWAELAAHEITLTPALVDTYFREIQPPDAVRQAWAAQRERGTAWQERYRKSARIELARGDETPEMLRRLREPLGLALEAVIEGDEPLRVGRPVTFRLLAQGQPVPAFAVQLVSDRSRLGVWARTDAQGRVQHTLPFPGRWALRGTLLEPDGEDRWESRFVTLVFEAR